MRLASGGMAAARVIGLDLAALARAGEAAGVPAPLAWFWAVAAERGAMTAMEGGDGD